MPTFTGTKDEFNRYIGPRLRNLVQGFTKKHKATVAACQHCGANNNLESAHIHNRTRKQIVDILLVENNPENGINLKSFETQFRLAHDPLEKAFLILCHSCHTKYDSNSAYSQRVIIDSDTNTDSALKYSKDILPITLEPSVVTEFKRQLLLYKQAEIITYYNDGRKISRPWNASQFSARSNVMGNLRSRPEFRPAAWQKAGIVKVHARICVDA